MAYPVGAEYVLTEPEREGRNRLARLLHSLHQLAYAERDARIRRNELRERLDAFRRVHVDFWRANTRKVAGWWGCVLALLGIWWLDIVLSMPTSQYYVTKYAQFGPRGVWVACILIPTGILLVEFFVIAGQRLAARDAAIDGLPGAYWGWTAAGLLLALVISWLIASTQLADIRQALTTIAMLRGRFGGSELVEAARDLLPSADTASAVYADLWAIRACSSRTFLPWSEDPSAYPIPEYLEGIVDERTGDIDRALLERRLDSLKPAARL